jgi:hypothetical protein
MNMTHNLMFRDHLYLLTPLVSRMTIKPEITSGLYNEATGEYVQKPLIPSEIKTPKGTVKVLTAKEPEPPKKDPEASASLDLLKDRASRLSQVELLIEEQEAELARLKEEKRKLSVETIPQMMFELEINSIGLGNIDKVVELEPLILGSLPSADPKNKWLVEYNRERREQIFNWLIDRQLGGNIKRTLEVDLKKGDAIQEHKVIDALAAVDPTLNPRIESTIHHQTYSALCRRLIEEAYDTGEVIPIDLLNIYVSNIARVK